MTIPTLLAHNVAATVFVCLSVCILVVCIDGIAVHMCVSVYCIVV